MDKAPRLIPIWLWVSSIIIIIVLLFGCRGGRSLGSGSAGTVIVPQTPKQINESNRQPSTTPPIPIPPVVITPPVITPPVITPPVITPPVVKLPPAPPVKLTPAKTRPTPTPNSSANANPVIINPKSAGEQKPFAPTHSNRNAPPAKLVNVIKLPPDDNGKGTPPLPQIAGPCEAAPEERPFIKWGELISYWLFVILMVIFGWVVYDTVMGFIKEKKLGNKENSRAKKAQEKLIKKPAKGTKASRKKALSKKNENPKR
jgi:hypothetical protein